MSGTRHHRRPPQPARLARGRSRHAPTPSSPSSACKKNLATPRPGPVRHGLLRQQQPHAPAQTGEGGVQQPPRPRASHDDKQDQPPPGTACPFGPCQGTCRTAATEVHATVRYRAGRHCPNRPAEPALRQDCQKRHAPGRCRCRASVARAKRQPADRTRPRPFRHQGPHAKWSRSPPRPHPGSRKLRGSSWLYRAA